MILSGILMPSGSFESGDYTEGKVSTKPKTYSRFPVERPELEKSECSVDQHNDEKQSEPKFGALPECVLLRRQHEPHPVQLFERVVHYFLHHEVVLLDLQLLIFEQIRPRKVRHF